jgi:hypothetical protein
MILIFQSFFALIAFNLLSFNALFNSKEETILWKADSYPTWADYKGKPQNNGMVAETSTIIEISYGLKKGKVYTSVVSAFLPHGSWVKSKQKNDYILKHELLHFDITELNARILRKRFAEEIKTEKDYPKINKIYNEIIVDWQNMQAKYDAETNHSINEQQQALWNEKIAAELELLADYK